MRMWSQITAWPSAEFEEDTDVAVAGYSLENFRLSIVGADFDTSQMDPLFKKRLDNYWYVFIF